MGSDMIDNPGLDLSNAVQYHYGQFPPTSMDLARILPPLKKATASFARYDQMLSGMLNSETLLAPLRTRDAIVSSRMEGTISTLARTSQNKTT